MVVLRTMIFIIKDYYDITELKSQISLALFLTSPFSKMESFSGYNSHN